MGVFTITTTSSFVGLSNTKHLVVHRFFDDLADVYLGEDGVLVGTLPAHKISFAPESNLIGVLNNNLFEVFHVRDLTITFLNKAVANEVAEVIKSPRYVGFISLSPEGDVSATAFDGVQAYTWKPNVKCGDLGEAVALGEILYFECNDAIYATIGEKTVEIEGIKDPLYLITDGKSVYTLDGNKIYEIDFIDNEFKVSEVITLPRSLDESEDYRLIGTGGGRILVKMVGDNPFSDVMMIINKENKRIETIIPPKKDLEPMDGAISPNGKLVAIEWESEFSPIGVVTLWTLKDHSTSA